MYLGETSVESDAEAADLLGLGKMLAIEFPKELSARLNEMAERAASQPAPSPPPKIRLRNPNELFKTPEKEDSKTRMSCDKCGKAFSLNVALEKHRKRCMGSNVSAAAAENVTVELNPFGDSGDDADETLTGDEALNDDHTYSNTQTDENVRPGNDDDDDDEPMILDMLPPPPPPQLAEAILNIMNKSTANAQASPNWPNKRGRPPIVHPSDADPTDLDYEPVDKRAKTSPEKRQIAGEGNFSGADCPICHKFYLHGKKREHYASTHFQVTWYDLRRLES